MSVRRRLLSNIASDTRDIAKRMIPWEAPKLHYYSNEVPDWEYLRVHSLRLADAFDDVYADWNAACREIAKWKEWSEYAQKRFREETGKDLQAQAT